MSDRITPLINDLEIAVARLKVEWNSNKAIDIAALSKIQSLSDKLNREVYQKKS